ncbi:hypothetical protein NXF25_015429 [Crotalus adamanteus]|uniref:Uncharacterized protein n=1 Tax=Crotalus adamanteus TaxID=8729 RepID=A0AAW1AVA2_CROAD
MHSKNPDWSLLMFSAELFMQYSRKINVLPKNYRSPFPISWGWS